MDEARCEELGQLITSEELYIIDNVKSLNFSCDECCIQLLPCSYLKDVNLRKPYFKTRKGGSHKQGCDAEGESKVRSKGATTRLTSAEGFPFAYPNRFKLRKDDLLESLKIIEPSNIAKRLHNKSNNGQAGSNGRKPNYETTSFKSVVNQFFDFPFDRDRALVFEGVEGTSYDEIFRRIRSTQGRQKFLIQGDIQKVYFASLPWKLCHEDGDTIKIELSPGHWVVKDRKRINERPCYLEVDFSTWPEQNRIKFLSEYKKVIELVRGTERKAAIAFVGKQDVSEDFFRFNAIDRYLIAFKLFHDA